jgi:type I restriction enzyme M protein
LVDAYLPDLRDQLTACENEGAKLQAALDSIIEEHSGDEGLLSEVLSEKGKIVKKLMSTRIKEISQDIEFSDEFKVLNECLEIQEHIDSITSKIKSAKTKLNDQLLISYKDLNEEKIKHLALKKWTSALTAYVEEDRLRVSQNLVARISTLSARYDEVFDTMVNRVEKLDKAIRVHLIHMGVAAYDGE